MTLSPAAADQLAPLIPRGLPLRFTYHGTPREGVLETVGEGPAGAFLLVRHPGGDYKSYSLAKLTGLEAKRAA